MRLLLPTRPVENRRLLLLKAHIPTYTKKNGSVVQAHEDNRPSAKWYGDERHLPEIMDLVRGSPHKHHALRVMTPHPQADDAPPVSVGDVLQDSYHWKDGVPTNRRLKGTCGANVRGEKAAKAAIGAAADYFGRQVVLMGGDEARAGTDDGEKKIVNPRVLAVWHREKVGCGRHGGGRGSDWDE